MSMRAHHLLLISLLWVSGFARAQSFDTINLHHTAPGTDGGTVGLVAYQAPRYLGSEDTQTQLRPWVSYQWADGWFAGLDNGLGRNFSQQPGLLYGARLTLDMGRSGDTMAFRGQGQVPLQPELGIFAIQETPAGFTVGGSIRHGSGNAADGTVVDLAVGFATSLSPSWRLATRVRATLADAAYMRSYFGVDATQAASSVYPVFQARAGVRDTGWSASLTYVLAQRMALTGSCSGSTLGDEVRASPWVRKDSATTFALVLSYAL